MNMGLGLFQNPGDSAVKNLPAMQEPKEMLFNPWVRKIPWREGVATLQCSCLENPTDRGAWQAIVHRVAKSWTQLKQLSMHIVQPRTLLRLKQGAVTNYARTSIY